MEINLMNTNKLIYIVQLVVLFILILFIMSIPSRAQTNNNVYGCAWNADGLANLEIGKQVGRQISYRFSAEHHKNVTAVMILLAFRTSGYYRGDGGKILLQLQNDDTTLDHNPSGVVLASSLIDDPMSLETYRLFTLNTPVLLQKGKIYHLVFSNPTPDPINNYVSIDCLYSVRGLPNMQPAVSDTNLAVVWKPGESYSWRSSYSHSPIFCLYYDDSTRQGQGYIDTRISSGMGRISGDSKVRENFTVTGVDKNVYNISIRVKKISGLGNLKVRLENSNGNLIEEGAILASSIGSNYEWVTYRFNTEHILTNGQSYNVVLSAPSNSEYHTFPLEDGSKYGFGCPSLFNDGHYQYTSGSYWQNLNGRTDFDLQLYFTLVNNPPPQAPKNLRAIYIGGN